MPARLAGHGRFEGVAGRAQRRLVGKGNGFMASTEGARGDLVDRDGRLLAVDLTHYALYVDPREVWDKHEARRALGRALPEVPAKRLDRVVFGDRRIFTIDQIQFLKKDWGKPV